MADNQIEDSLLITEQEFNAIYETTFFNEISRKILNLYNTTCKEESCQKGNLISKIKNLKNNIDLNEFVLQLQNRMVDVAKCYIILSFYYKKEIPDDEWYISPGRNNQSIEYFPHFEDIHYKIKEWYDYYADTFYYKYFSLLDNIGHMLNFRYKLLIDYKRVNFEKAIKKLEGNEDNIFKLLNNIISEEQYNNAKDFRNDITHNILPSTTGLDININENSGSFGIRKYIKSKDIKENIDYLVLLMKRIIIILEENI